MWGRAASTQRAIEVGVCENHLCDTHISQRDLVCCSDISADICNGQSEEEEEETQPCLLHAECLTNDRNRKRIVCRVSEMSIHVDILIYNLYRALLPCNSFGR
jgi:hypothetical protein